MGMSRLANGTSRNRKGGSRVQSNSPLLVLSVVRFNNVRKGMGCGGGGEVITDD